MNTKDAERVDFLNRAIQSIEPYVRYNISVAEASLKFNNNHQEAMLPQLLLICNAHKMKQFSELNEFLSDRKAEIHRKEIKAV